MNPDWQKGVIYDMGGIWQGGIPPAIILRREICSGPDLTTAGDYPGLVTEVTTNC
jgi:hypothetical protein